VEQRQVVLVAQEVLGSASSVTGSSVTYAGGGGGEAESGTAGAGGSGGGGNGSLRSGTGSTAGTANTGGGGGGGDNIARNPAQGGSGVVIISIATTAFSNLYAGSNVAVTTAGSNTVVSFYASGTYTA